MQNILVLQIELKEIKGMARPQRNNVDYFPFYCDEGKKMFYLEETYGNDGFATFIKILRELAKTDFHYLDLSKNTTMMFLSAKCKITKETLRSIVNDLVDLNKFDKVLWEENSIIWCEDFTKSIQDAYIKRKNKCMNYEGLLLHLISLGVRKPPKGKLKGDVKPQSILEYNKLEYNKEQLNNITIREAEFKNSLQPFINTYSKDMLNDFFSYWTEKKPKGRKMLFEMNRTWDVSKRLVRWNNNNFNKNTKDEKQKQLSTLTDGIREKFPDM